MMNPKKSPWLNREKMLSKYDKKICKQVFEELL